MTSTPEFVAVVLAATVGAGLLPLTSAPPGGVPKHLLPIVGIPAVVRLLLHLTEPQSVRFQHVILAVSHQDHDVTLSTVQLYTKDWNWVERENSTEGLASVRMFQLKNLDVQISFVSLSGQCDGSADAIREIEGQKDLIPSPHCNVVVIPGDLVLLQNASVIQSLVGAHRRNNPSFLSPSVLSTACTVLLADVGQVDEQTRLPLKESAKVKKGVGYARDENEIEYMALQYSHDDDSSSPRLILKASKIAVETDRDLTGQTPKLALPKSRLLNVSGFTRVRTEWYDLRVYILSPWVRFLLRVNRPGHARRIASLSADLLPLLIQYQFRSIGETLVQVAPHATREDLAQLRTIIEGRFARRVENDDESGDAAPSSNSALSGALTPNSMESDPGTNAMDDGLLASRLEQEDAGWILPSSSSAQQQVSASYAVRALVAPSTAAVRIRSIPMYLHASKDMLTMATTDSSTTTGPATGADLPSGAVVHAKFQSCFLVEERADTDDLAQARNHSSLANFKAGNFRTTCLGRSVTLGAQTKCQNCIVLDHAILGNQVSLQNCVVGTGAVIGANSSLHDCQVAPYYEVPVGTKAKGQAFKKVAD
jgi:NDP-sugar pyrophosphorylase family protein